MDSLQYITRLKQGPYRKLLKKANTIYIYVEKRRVVKIMISYTNRSRMYQKVIDESELPQIDFYEPSMKDYDEYYCQYTTHPLTVDFYKY